MVDAWWTLDLDVAVYHVLEIQNLFFELNSKYVVIHPILGMSYYWKHEKEALKIIVSY